MAFHILATRADKMEMIVGIDLGISAYGVLGYLIIPLRETYI